MSNLRKAVEGIDWKLLREQKEYVSNEADNDNDNENVAIYTGLLHLIDAIQDAAIDDGIATATEVFLETDE